MDLQEIKDEFAKEEACRDWRHFADKEEIYWDIDTLLERAWNAALELAAEKVNDLGIEFINQKFKSGFDVAIIDAKNTILSLKK